MSEVSVIINVSCLEPPCRLLRATASFAQFNSKAEKYSHQVIFEIFKLLLCSFGHVVLLAVAAVTFVYTVFVSNAVECRCCLITPLRYTLAL